MRRVDDLDIKILSELAKDASISVPKLSKKINVNSSVVYSRIKRLVKGGLIKKFTIIINDEALGFSVKARTGINMDSKLRDNVLNELFRISEVREVAEVTGRFDILLTKPKIWYLLVFTAFGAALTASFLFDVPITLLTWMLLLGGVAAGSAAADTLTGYNDRDIDAIMERTKNRPIPSGRISPRNALIFGLILAAISLACAWFINIWAFGLMAFGLFDNILVYSKWLKRRSQSNIILGGFSGGAPALIGYIAVTTQNIEIGLVMAGLVFLWIPTHIWSLSLYVKKDYARAGIPILPLTSYE